MNFGLLPVNKTDKLGSVIVPTTRVRMPKNGSDWLQPGHDIEENTAHRVTETKAKNHYNFKRDFETMREIKDFEKEHFSMSQITLYSTPLGTNTTNGTTSPIDSIPVRKKRQSLYHLNDQLNCQREKGTQ